MLIQLRVENHRSLRDEQVLSMVAADLGDAGSERLIRAEGFEHALLPAVALYGANASGKSNVIGALAFMQRAVLESHRLWNPEGGAPQEPFALSTKANEPSLYEVDIMLEGTRLRYGFVLSAGRIEEEWLYAWPRDRKQLWFEREGDAFRFGKALRGENEAIKALTRPNSLFLSAAAQNNPEQNPRGAQLIFTTHDTNLLGGILDEPPLRRDQVWFTEKDKGGATHLYPLTDFHPREEENLERGYLQGRYGAIPFLGRLVSAPEKAAPEKKKKRKG
jgi:hypothetical protein